MDLYDAHFHPENYVDGKGIAGGLCCSASMNDWEKVLGISRKNRKIIPCVGVHPWNIGTINDGIWTEMRHTASRTGAFIGEIGLDKLRPDVKMQEKIFAEQLLIAKEIGRPAIIHCVREYGRLLEMIKETNPGRFMIHAFNGSPETMRQVIAMGGFASFGPGLANEKAKKSRAAFLSVPIDKFMLESEGGITQHSGLMQAAEAAAKIKNMPVSTIISAANDNYIAFCKHG